MTRKQPDTALVRIDDTVQLGPAMQALPTARMRAFVVALVHTGCTIRRAAEMAGYSASSNGALYDAGYHLAHDPRIQAALHEEGIKALRASGVAGISILANIAENPQEAARDRISAVKEIMSRGGFSTATEHNVTVTHRSEQELDSELLAIAAELGFTDEQKARLIGRPVVRKGKITDAVIIKNDDTIEPAIEPDMEADDACLWSEPQPLANESGAYTDDNPEEGNTDND